MATKLRSTAVLVHRWAGLFIALFLVISGLTGSIIAFHDEIDEWLNPHFYELPFPQGQERPDIPLAPEVLKEKLEQNPVFAKSVFGWFPLDIPKDKTLSLYLTAKTNPDTGQLYELENDIFFINPYTAEVVGQRSWANFRVDREHFIPLVYKIHYSLALPQPYGMVLFGIISIIWMIDCFVGGYLTFPQKKGAFFKNWQSAWKIKWKAVFTRMNLDIHRAVGLWFWAVLLMIATSGMMFNLYEQIYYPVMKNITTYKNPEYEAPMLAEPVSKPVISFNQALTIGRNQMKQWQEEEKFQIVKEESLYFMPYRNLYSYTVESSLDLPDSYGQTKIFFSATTGQSVGKQHPHLDAGNAITTWLALLHTGHVFGLTYRIFVSVVGVLVAILSVTGVIVWWKKRTARQRVKEKRSVEFSPETALH